MERAEVIEWIVIIGAILAWWPRIFMGYNPLWYHVLIYYVTPLLLALIFVRRLRRMEQGLEYSRKIVDAQHKASGTNILGYPAMPPTAGKEDDASDDNDI